LNPSWSLDSLEFKAQTSFISSNAFFRYNKNDTNRQVIEQARFYNNTRTENILSTLQLPYQKAELISYLEWRKTGLSNKSSNWMAKAANIFWTNTKGVISKKTTDAVRAYVFEKYQCDYAKGKVLNFAKRFLKYLTKTTFDTRYVAFELFLEKPKRLKERKLITNKIVTKEDIENVPTVIRQAEHNNEIDHNQSLQFTALVLFGAYTGQRSYSTIKQLIVGQFKAALYNEKPVLHIQSHQDEIRMAHYCPLHPQVVEAILPLVNDRTDNELMFMHLVCQITIAILRPVSQGLFRQLNSPVLFEWLSHAHSNLRV